MSTSPPITTYGAAAAPLMCAQAQPLDLSTARVPVTLADGTVKYLTEAELTAELAPASEDYFLGVMRQLKRVLPSEIDLLDECIEVLTAQPDDPLPSDAYAYAADLRDVAAREPTYRQELLETAAFLEQLLDVTIDGEEVNVATKYRPEGPAVPTNPPTVSANLFPTGVAPVAPEVPLASVAVSGLEAASPPNWATLWVQKMTEAANKAEPTRAVTGPTDSDSEEDDLESSLSQDPATSPFRSPEENNSPTAAAATTPAPPKGSVATVRVPRLSAGPCWETSAASTPTPAAPQTQ